jgi:BNR/Asp-box repeat.
MKKKTAATVCVVSMLLLSGCGKKDQITNNYQEGASQWTLVGSVPLGTGLNYQPPTPFLGVIGTDLFASISCPPFWNDGVHRSSDNGVSWTPVMPDSLFVSALAVKSSYIFAAYSFWDTTHLYHYGISRSTDKGVTWSPTAFSNTTDTVKVYSLAANSGFIFAGTRNGVYRSSNGDAWTQTALPVPSGYTFMVQSLAINNSYIFAGTYIFDGCVGYNTPKIYRSSDNGDSWVTVNNPDSIYATTLAVSGADLFAISMDPAHNYQKYGLYRSSDNGMTWNDVLSFPLSAIAISGDTIITYTTNYNTIIGNVLFSTDKGATWTQTEGVCDATTNLVANNGYLFTLDAGGNIWRRSLVGL